MLIAATSTIHISCTNFPAPHLFSWMIISYHDIITQIDTPLLCSSPGHKAAAQASSSSTSALSAVSNFFGSYFWNSDPSSDSHTVTSSLLPISSHIPAESSLLDGGRTPHGNSQRDRADSAYGYGRMGGGEQAVQGETRSRGML